MAQVITTSVVRQIESLFGGGSVAGLTDRQLLERFVTHRDATAEDAFAALVTRHGPMVLGVCRQLLGDRQHAEDAFQAVFLVLARRARSLRDPDLLSNWLYGVARRTARKARARLDRRRKDEEDHAAVRRPETDAAVPADRPAIDRERAEALHEEVDRLPSPFRLPVVLCYFEGLTLDEAARRLHCPAGTVHSRLVRARDKLRRGLTRRGIVLPASALAAALAPRSASASVSSPLCDITTRAAIHFATGQPAAGAASALAREVLRSMLIHKLRVTMFSMMVLGAIATGAGYLTQALAMKDEPPKVPAALQNQIADANPKPAPGRMFVVGRVLDPQGKPVPNASVMVHARSKTSGSGYQYGRLHPVPIAHAVGDGSGGFRIDAPRTSSSQYDTFCAVALAPGYGAGWVELDPDDDRPAAEITLRPEQVIHGRLFDVQGRPARGVRVSVWSIGRVLSQGSPRRRYERLDRTFYYWSNLNAFPAWPGPATTDPEGRFTLRGIGRGLRVILTVHDPRFALQWIEIETDQTSESKSLTMALAPAQIITGRVTYADTGKPVAHARLEVGASKEGGTLPNDGFETDAEGRFRVTPSPGDFYTVEAYPPDGKPYQSARRGFDWPKGAVEHSVDLALPRGVVIRGKVTEEGSGKPVSGARVWFVGRRPGDRSIPRYSMGNSGPDGSFQLAARAAPGCLVIEDPGDDFVLREIGFRMLSEGQPGGSRAYAHAFIACDPQSGSNGPEIHVALRRGVTVQGRVLAPDGQPARDTWMLSRVILEPMPQPWRSWLATFYGTARNGRFQIHGLDPDTEVPVYFFDPKRRLGATAHLPGKSAAGGPVSIRLEPCGTATARLIDPGGKPIAGARGSRQIAIVVTPGPSPNRAQPIDDRLAADVASADGIDPINYANGPVSDAQGRITFPALIPGATYRISQLRKDFTVKPAETLDLGDIVIEKPRP
jgi:RNA polymerase sigma factor (sigma-70 family)